MKNSRQLRKIKTRVLTIFLHQQRNKEFQDLLNDNFCNTFLLTQFLTAYVTFYQNTIFLVD